MTGGTGFTVEPTVWAWYTGSGSWKRFGDDGSKLGRPQRAGELEVARRIRQGCVTYVLDGTKEVAQDVRAASKAALTWLKESAGEALWQKYPNAGKILKAAGRVAAVSTNAAKRAIYWLTFVNRMTDEAALRFVPFFEKYAQELGDRWLAKWTALTDGERAVKEAFEATERAGDMADGVHDALVLAGTKPHPIPGKSYAAEFTGKYGEQAEAALAKLRQSADDTRFTDGVVGQTVRDLSDPKLPRLSPEAVEGAARSMLVDCVV